MNKSSNKKDIVTLKQKFPTFKFNNGVILRGDCLKVLKNMKDDDIILAFTSPPYFNAINYEEHIEKINGKRDRWERKDVSYEEYKKFLVERFKTLLKVMVPGGFNIVNISPVSWNGNRVPLPFHFVGWMEEIGWKFKEDIIWEKPIARDRRSGLLLQHPYPGYYYPSLVSEYVLVFQKPADKKKKNNIYWFRTQKEKEENELDLSDYQGEMSKNVWKIRPVAPQENIHPCPFPQELAERVINLYSYKGDKIIDIFSGSGQALLAAQKLRRKFIGIETQQSYIEYSVKKLKNNQSQKKLSDLK